MFFTPSSNGQSDSLNTTIRIQKESSDTLKIITNSIFLNIFRIDSSNLYQSIVSGFYENAPNGIKKRRDQSNSITRKVILSFDIDNKCHFTGVSLTKSTGYGVFDRYLLDVCKEIESYILTNDLVNFFQENCKTIKLPVDLTEQ